MPAPSCPFEAFLSVRAATGGTLSPDGRTLAFLLNTSGVPQVYRLDAPGEEPRPLTQFTEIGRSVHWAPDGRRLLFTMDAGGSEREQLYLLAPDGSEVRPLTADPKTIHTFGGWAPDGRRIAFSANRRNQAFFDVYVMDVDTGEEQCVLQRDSYFTVGDWSPDGARLLVREHLASMDQDLYELELASGAMRRLTPHTGSARYGAVQVLPGGRTALVCTDQDRDFVALALLDLETADLRRVWEEDADVETCDVARNGSAVLLVNRGGWSEIVAGRVDAGGFTEAWRRSTRWVVSGCRIAGEGARYAVSMNGPACNGNVMCGDAGSSDEPLAWTAAPFGVLDPSILVQPEAVRYPTHDGLEIPAWLYRPEGAGERRPVIVYTHGGPESQDRPNFNPVYQYLVHRGYAVLAPNVRGSTGYGNAYCHMDDREKRYDALRDVEHAYHWLVSSGIGDPARIGIMGGSYGGFTVLACLTRQPELWAAGVDVVGIANFETFFKHTGPWRRHLRASEYGDPERDAALLRDLSPIHSVHRIRAPLMVIQGANDPRVPQEESDQMVEQLRARSHPVEYLLFPDEGHGIVKLPNRIRAYTAVGEFLDRYLR
jgi:dipeptidyl aminopeptidase/acylaminoacyl peptidase